MGIKLLNLKLKNFKGIKDFELDAKGQNVRIYGDNGTGKTTLADAFSWLLFDKDSRGQSTQSFEIKTLDENNEPIHGIEHQVEGVIEVDEKSLALKKVYYEKWTKKRGSATKTFEGHTTDYYINDVPVKKKEYDARIAEIIDEEIFKMLTNPGYFNEQLHWEDRRRILLEVCGDVSNEDVLAKNKDLDKLADILKERSLDEHKKIIASRRKKINKELEKIPVRIDEVQQGLPDVSCIDQKTTEAKIKELTAQKKGKDQELARVENGGEIAEKKKRLAEFETELENIKREHTAEYEEKIQEAKSRLVTAKDDITEIQRNIRAKDAEINDNQVRINRLERKADELRQKWYEVNGREFDYNDTCPTCGQKLPEKQIEAVRADFNREKAKRLEEITSEGKQIKLQIEEIKALNTQLLSDIKLLEKDLERMNKKEKELIAEIEELEQKAAAYQDSFQYKKKLAEKESLEQSIEGLQRNASQAAAGIEKEIRGLENQIKIQEQRLSMIERYNQGQARIEELKQQEKELAREFEKLEEELYLCEEFTRTKVDLLEGKINSKFKLARFKLFETQVNGGINECCETLVNGVPYGTNLNTGAQVNVGLDIINTLSEHYDFYAPIFIDGRESVTELIETKSQVISLIVSEKDKKLRVEVEEKKIKEAV